MSRRPAPRTAAGRRRALLALLACAAALVAGVAVAALAGADPLAPRSPTGPTVLTTPTPTTTTPKGDPGALLRPAPVKPNGPDLARTSGGSSTAPATTQTDPESTAVPDDGNPLNDQDDGSSGDGDTDPSSIFGLSPFCPGSDTDSAIGTASGGVSARNCRESGSIAEPHPLSHYGLDNQVDVKLSSFDTMVASTIQSTIQVIWIILLYLLRGTMSLLELSFSSDIIHGSIGKLHQALRSMDDAFGTAEWQVVALSALGLWGIWNGLVRMRSIQTFGGLMAAVGLMIAVQVVMVNPEDTVGRLASLSDQTALTTISLGTQSQVAHPVDAFAASDQDLFNTLIVTPWCALEFGNSSGCLAPQGTKTDPEPSIADVWLATSADSDLRHQLFKHQDGKPFTPKYTKDECKDTGFTKAVGYVPIVGSPLVGTSKAICRSIWRDKSGRRQIGLKYDDEKSGIHTDPSIQGVDGALTRAALLALVGFGLLGAIFFLLKISFRLLMASLQALFYLFALVFAGLLAAFGAAGRQACLGILQRAVGAIIAKVVYAAVLVVFLRTEAFVAQLQTRNFFLLWLMIGILCWGAFAKLDEAVGWFSLDKRTIENGGLGLGGGGGGRGRGGLMGLGGLYVGWRMARDVGRLAGRPIGAVREAGRVRAAEGALATHDRAAQAAEAATEATAASEELDLRHRTAESTAVREADGERLREDMGTGERARARRVVQSHDRDARELAAIRARRTQIDRKLHPARGTAPHGERYRRLQDEDLALAGREANLSRSFNLAYGHAAGAAELDRARGVLSGGAPPAGREAYATWASARADDIARLPADHERNLLAAGINPDVYARALPASQAAMRAQSAETMARHRDMFATTGSSGPLPRADLDRAWQRIGSRPEGLRATRRTGEELTELRRADAERAAARDRAEARQATRRAEQTRADRRRRELENATRRRSRRGVR